MPTGEATERAGRSPRVHNVVIDSDASNEIDDQFALALAALSPDAMTIQAIYAAPYAPAHNRRDDPGKGMLRAYEEIRTVLDRLALDDDVDVLHGARQWMVAPDQPVGSPAVDDLVDRARDSRGGEPLTVIAIGAATNVSSALVAAPDIIPDLTVVWLGGNPSAWPSAAEFNLDGDPHASRVLLDSGVKLVRVPAFGVAELMRVTRQELAEFVRPCGAIGEYLWEIYEALVPIRPGQSSPLWDVAAVAWAIEPTWTPTIRVPSPILTAGLTWAIDPARHLVDEVLRVERDNILGDLYAKLRRHADRGVAN